MSKTAYLTARIEPALKSEAEAILSTLGVSTTDAITMLFRQVVLNKGLPFSVRIPNSETINAIRAANAKSGSHYESISQLLGEIDEEIASE